MVLRGPHHPGLEGRDRVLAPRRALSPIVSIELARWLRCPACGLDLVEAGALVLGCATGHRFDVNRRGWLTALDSRSGIHGDPRELLEARRAFLDAGHYSPIVEALDGLVPPDARIIDSGCGTGYYSAALLARRPAAIALEMDASVDAVRMAVSATRMPGLVADVWKPWPVRDDVADVVLCVFAPRHPAEGARVLVPGGRAIVVTPLPDHLGELRTRGAILDIEPDKIERLDAAHAAAFDLESRRDIRYRLELSAEQADLAAAMGPSGYHERERVDAALTVTVAMTVSVFRRC